MASPENWPGWRPISDEEAHALVLGKAWGVHEEYAVVLTLVAELDRRGQELRELRFRLDNPLWYRWWIRLTPWWRGKA